MGEIHARLLQSRAYVDLAILDPANGLEVPEDFHPDFAVIASPTSTHASVALPLLSAGTPCLIEKPLAHNLQEARTLAAFAHLSVGHVERFNPAWRVAEEVRPRFIQAERLAIAGPRGTDVDVIADLMIHDLDLVMQLLPGPVREIRATGVGVTGEAFDIVNARIHKGNGVATLTASRVSRRPLRKLRLFEPGTYWSIDLLERSASRVHWETGDLHAEPVEIPGVNPLYEEQEAFLDAVRGRRSYPVPGTEAVATMELAQQIREAVTC
jgi:predicted dehydrogenase